MKTDPIKIGSIVRVITGFPVRDTKHIGIVIFDNIWMPGGLKIQIPDNGTVECSVSNCYNATEAERKGYFKAVLKHGQ